MTKARASRALENAARRFGIVHVAGVDEVGRGCLAGPVVAAAVILHPDRYIPGVADSKLLQAETRERLSLEIIAAAVAWNICVIEAPEIDRLNIHKASLHAMHEAVMGLVPLPGLVLIDGFLIPQLVLAQRSLVGGDRRVSAIAAASIVAKVHRDRLMCELHARDPRSGFDRHKGYATADHLAAVDRCGYSDAHRRTFRPPTLFGPL
jgi:ribonuclease HII